MSFWIRRFINLFLGLPSTDAWSMDQESVELYAYLVLEADYLQKFATLVGREFTPMGAGRDSIATFYDRDKGYFFDRRLGGEFVHHFGPEGWSPLWTGLANKEQAESVYRVMTDTARFSSYIPFPTAALSEEKFMDRGYWRGPIWLDQVYFAIAGLRKYGYQEDADRYTRQVFERLDGLNGDAPIHENYEARTGARLKAPHFSWSAAHLFMLYKDLGQ